VKLAATGNPAIFPAAWWVLFTTSLIEQVIVAAAASGLARAWPLVMVWLAALIQVKPAVDVPGVVSVKVEDVMFLAPLVTTTVYTTVAPSCGSLPPVVVAPATAQHSSR
jgi:hypothetical protein